MNPFPRPARLSFCTTCKNRLWQLRQTLPVNLYAIGFDGEAELVLVNYNSQDGLDGWLRQFQPEIDAGRLRYFHESTQTHYHASKAKNLAHFGATGDYLINLDADNFIGDTIETLRSLWEEGPDSLIHGFCGNYADGTYGRIGLSRESFRRLGGYDEDMMPMAHQDRDLISRARASGMPIVKTRQSGVPAIRNGCAEKMKYLGVRCSFGEMSERNSKHLDENLRLGRLSVNASRRPMPVCFNFNHAVEI